MNFHLCEFKFETSADILCTDERFTELEEYINIDEICLFGKSKEVINAKNLSVMLKDKIDMGFGKSNIVCRNNRDTSVYFFLICKIRRNNFFEARDLIGAYMEEDL